jgi:hypothetical protein
VARIAGVDIPRDKRIEVALTYIYGIGRTLSNKILAQAGIDPNKRTIHFLTMKLPGSGIYSRLNTRSKAISERSEYEYKEVDGYRMLPRSSAQTKPSGPWPENEDEFQDP